MPLREVGYSEDHILPVLLMEPDSKDKRRHYSEMFLEPKKWFQPTLEEVKQRIKEIRNDSLTNLEALVTQLNARLAAHPEVEMTFAQEVGQAVEKIKGIACGARIAINKSAVIGNELMRPLVASGFDVIESYYEEFKPFKNLSAKYWQPPTMTFESRFQSFGRPLDLTLSRNASIQKNGAKDFVGLLGVNAISAEDGIVLILQHMHNIEKVFEQAREIILVVGLDKIVKSLDDAIFQTKCVGVFGSEALPLNLQGRAKQESRIDQLPFNIPFDQTSSKINLILLDNDRTSLSKSQFENFFLCIDCGSCNASCPANRSGKSLSPQELIFNFKKYLPQVSPELLEGIAEVFPAGDDKALSGEKITEEEIWACTTCRACQEVCPVQLEPFDAIVGLRRNLVMISTSNPTSKAVRNPLRNIEAKGHPWTGITLAREGWTEGLGIKILAENSDVDILYWVGCTEALDDRSMKIAQSMGRLMRRAGVNFGILGAEESCCGDPARRLGNEYLFQLQAQKNIKVLQSYHVKKIVTACPHCYHTIKNEYPQFGGEFEVMHHTELIANLLKEGRLRIGEGEGGVITYQDPCYLGRYNNIYQPPRQVLESIPGRTVVEMEQNRERSFCCGGGGGRMWLEENIGQRIGEMRLEQALETHAGAVTTACPFCLQMFEDAIKTKGIEESLKVMDIAELMDGSVTR
jgi:Fe-S oxidoreductase